jgi:hypothetical protein
MLKNRATGKCVDVSGSPGTNEGAHLQQWTCENGCDKNTDQVWSMDKYGRLVNRVSKKCIDVSGLRSRSNFANIQLWSCESPSSSNTDHIWVFKLDATGNYVQIRNRHTGKCVDVSGYANKEDGVHLQQYTCEGDQPQSDQWWRVVFVN